MPQAGIAYVLYMFQIRLMPSIPEQRLIWIALQALEQTAQKARDQPLERNHAIRLCLAYLASRSPERWPFDEYWKALADDDDKIRSANLTRCLNAMYLRLVIKRRY